LNRFFGDSPGNRSDDATVRKLEFRIPDLRQSGFGLGTRSSFLSVGDLQVFPGNIHGCQVRFVRGDAGFGLRLSCVEVLFRNNSPTLVEQLPVAFESALQVIGICFGRICLSLSLR
jgi:hypothetical protein